MMPFINRYQNFLIAAVLIIAAFVVYTFLFTGEEEAVLSEREVSEEAAVDNDLIALLLELRAINLDDSIFNDSIFQSLVDFSQELVPEPVGRTNPFSPLEPPR